MLADEYLLGMKLLVLLPVQSLTFLHSSDKSSQLQIVMSIIRCRNTVINQPQELFMLIYGYFFIVSLSQGSNPLKMYR